MFVFVYGSLRKGFGNHDVLGDSPFICTASTLVPRTLHDLGAFPAVCLDGNTHIVGEVYDVDDHVFARLDMLEGYPDFYDRKIEAVEDADGQEYEAWMYYIDEDFQDTPIVESGDWAECYERAS